MFTTETVGKEVRVYTLDGELLFTVPTHRVTKLAEVLILYKVQQEVTQQ